MKSALHVINSLDPENGGTSVSVPSLMLATAETGRFRNMILEADGQHHLKPLGPLSQAMTASFSIPRVLLNMTVGGKIDDAIRSVDVVQIHGLWQRHCITVGILSRRNSKPLVISAHGMLERWALHNKFWKKVPYSLLVERPNLRHAALLRALTAAEAADYRRFGLTNPIAIIPNGIDPASDASPSLWLDSWPELRDRRIVLYLSRVHYKKGVDLLVKAWASVAAQFPDAHLVIAGPDFEGTRPVIEQLVREHSLGSRVTFTGPVFGDLKASLLNAASVFILPSHSEGFSVAVLESLAAGVPVIITHGCNFPEVLTSGSGWVISPKVGEIVSALSEALESTSFDLKARGQQGQKLVRDKYTWQRIGQQMADAYEWLLGGSRPSSVEIWD